MNFLFKIIAIMLSCVMLQSCADMNKQGSGALIGGVAGGLLGSQFGGGEGRLLATGLGVAAGAMIGAQIGKSLDEHDRLMLAQTTQKALETATSGSTVEWSNPDSGNKGHITPVKTYKSNSGQYCREYNTVIVVGGKEEKAYGTACRQEDGSWKIIK